MRRNPPVVTWKAPIGSPAKVSKPADTTRVAGSKPATTAMASAREARYSSSPVPSGRGRLRLVPAPGPPPVSSAAPVKWGWGPAEGVGGRGPGGDQVGRGQGGVGRGQGGREAPGDQRGGGVEAEPAGPPDPAAQVAAAPAAQPGDGEGVRDQHLRP